MKIKVFQVRNPAGEDKVNDWMKEHNEDVQIVNVFTNAVAAETGSAMVLITFIYRELVDKGNPGEGKPPTYE